MLGGIGNLGGAMLGGVVLGLVRSFGAGYIDTSPSAFLSSSYQDIFAFIILGLVLIFPPDCSANACRTGPERAAHERTLVRRRYPG